VATLCDRPHLGRHNCRIAILAFKSNLDIHIQSINAFESWENSSMVVLHVKGSYYSAKRGLL